MAQITYTNKVALNENPEIANINKVTDDDMNEIKQVVNDNYNNTIQITDTEPTDSDNKIWIDTGEVGSQVSEITNEYSTSTGLGYSANYVNGKLNDINEKLDTSDLFIFQNVELTENITLAAFASVYKGTTCPVITGYSPILCYDVRGKGNANVIGYGNPIDPSTRNVGAWICNYTQQSITVPGVIFKVMYIRNN